jgi:predicted ester cyclase
MVHRFMLRANHGGIVAHEQTDLKQILDRNITAINGRDIEGLLANQQPDVVFELPGGVSLRGHDELRQYMEAMWEAFPDGVLAFGAQAFADGIAATEVAFTGTHTGPMPSPSGPIPPTGKAVTTHSVSVLHITDGLIASERVYGDRLEMMTQLESQ